MQEKLGFITDTEMTIMANKGLSRLTTHKARLQFNYESLRNENRRLNNFLVGPVEMKAVQPYLEIYRDPTGILTREKEELPPLQELASINAEGWLELFDLKFRLKGMPLSNQLTANFFISIYEQIVLPIIKQGESITLGGFENISYRINKETTPLGIKTIPLWKSSGMLIYNPRIGLKVDPIEEALEIVTKNSSKFLRNIRTEETSIYK